ncbi:F0F1 ATP synthase subunit alpha [Candidatus Omnitrophota bacterium]
MQKTSETNFDIREVGRIKSVRQFIVIATGLNSCINGQIVQFEQGNLGLVMGFKGDEAQILALGLDVTFCAGDEVYNRGQSLSLPVGDAFLGRVVNSLCEPVDGLGPIESSESCPVFSEAAGVMDRAPVDKTFETGTLVMDTVIPIAKGQRQLLIGDKLTGKTSVALDMVLNQKGKEVVCIYCCIGKPYSSLLKILSLFRERDVMPYSIVVSSVSSTSVGEQYLGPYVASMLGEHFMNKGKDVLVVFDDLTKHAWIYRQISLLLERAPGREAYPGDIFYVHSQLVERAGYLKPELGGGSMTFFPIIETLQGDLTGYIPTNMISMTDGQIYFNSALFKKGIKPAIDFGLSVSRVGNKAQWPGMRAFSKNFRLDYLQYQELLQMTRLRTSGLSQEAQARLKRGEVLTQIIVQDKNSPVSIEQQIIYLYAIEAKMLDGLSAQEIELFKLEFSKFLQKEHPDLFPGMRASRELSEEDKNKVGTALKKFFKK